jgi:ferredoxin
MISFIIDGKKIKAAPGTTILKAASKADIHIPTLCFLKDYPHHTSCMMCVVKDKSTDKLIPACTAAVEPGMDIETASQEVSDARRTTLELLLSEHIGDCEAPCRRACPTHMDIPKMLRYTSGNDFEQALNTVLEHIPLPALLSKICPAPCEKICRRKDYDQPVAIQTLIRMLARQNKEKLFVPPHASGSRKKIAVCGAGPAGLSAAFYLASSGNSVSIFEKNTRACDAICQEFETTLHITQAVEQEKARLQSLGVDFHFTTELGKDITLKRLLKDFNAVIIATGTQDSKFWETLRLEYSDKGAAADQHTYAIGKKKVFVCGSALQPLKLAANAVKQGRECALSVNGCLGTGEVRLKPRQFDSHIGRLQPEEIKEYLKLSNQHTTSKAGGMSGEHPIGVQGGRKSHHPLSTFITTTIDGGFFGSKTAGTASVQNKNLILTPAQSVKQAERCLHCDCRKASSCALRTHSTQYQARASRYKSPERKPLRIINSHPFVLYEPGKCIKCGRCVRITAAKREPLGLTFIGRGFDIEVGVPFNQALSKALTHTAEECVKSCPTGALAFKK